MVVSMLFKLWFSRMVIPGPTFRLFSFICFLCFLLFLFPFNRSAVRLPRQKDASPSFTVRPAQEKRLHESQKNQIGEWSRKRASSSRRRRRKGAKECGTLKKNNLPSRRDSKIYRVNRFAVNPDGLSTNVHRFRPNYFSVCLPCPLSPALFCSILEHVYSHPLAKPCIWLRYMVACSPLFTP